MKSKFENELDNSRLPIVKYGFIIMLTMLLLLGASLVLLKIDNRSILMTVTDYLLK